MKRSTLFASTRPERNTAEKKRKKQTNKKQEQERAVTGGKHNRRRGKASEEAEQGRAAELVCHLTSEPEGDGEAARRRPPQGGKDLLQLQPAGEREVGERAVGV